MSISTAYGPGKFGLSFELFPPKSEAAERELYANVAELMAFCPAFVTCTYGAGGSTRDKTLEIVTQVRDRFGCHVASHLTCVGATVDDLRAYLSRAWDRGVRNIVALRGDPPRGETQFEPVAGGLTYANQLVSLIRAEFPDFGVAVAGYPEKHAEAPSMEVDLQNLQRKVAAGADCVITQLFYDNDDFWRFRDRLEALRIGVPIVPGLLPITNLAQIRRITGLCGAKLPIDLLSALEAHEADPQGQFEIGVEFATRQSRELLAGGAPGVHYYVLNKSQATVRVLRGLGMETAAG